MSKQILLIEDDSAIMDTLTIFLTYEGFVVHKARSVEGALEALEQLSPDLVLLDYMLQDDTAEKVVDAVRVRHEKVPVILLTAADDPVGKARLLGVNRVVAKPFELDQLLRDMMASLDSRLNGAEGSSSRFQAPLKTPEPPDAAVRQRASVRPVTHPE